MRTHLTRRDILKLVGGGAVGFFFTPLPWKLLDDTSIWTQNWSMIPALPRGEVTARLSACTLCPGGCAVNARCVAGMPYGLGGVPGDPLSHGYICAAGLAGHHLAYHPLRLGSPMRFDGAGDAGRMIPISHDAAMDAALAMLREGEGSVAILDGQPGRAVSAFYQEFARVQENGLYLTTASREDPTLVALRSMMEGESAPLGFDLARASLIVSFGAPLFEGWGTPGGMNRLFRDRPSGAPRLVQVESRHSRTARGADQWIAARPGCERPFALALANLLLNSHTGRALREDTLPGLPAYRSFVAAFTPESVQEATGVEPSVIRRLAEELSGARAPIVLSGADPGGGPLPHDAEYAIAGLNLLLGNVGKEGGIVFRHEMPGTEGQTPLVREVRDVPDHSLRLLILDPAASGYALPWESLERKLLPGKGMVVSLSSYLNGISAHADIIIPTPAPYESLEDLPTHAGATAPTFRLSTRLLPARPGSVGPAAWVGRLASEAGLPLAAPLGEDSLLKERAHAIHRSRRGTLLLPSGGEPIPLASIATPDALWEKLLTGGVWLDDPMAQHDPVEASMATTIVAASDHRTEASDRLLLIPYGQKGAVSGSVVSPVMSKLSQESSLRLGAGTIALHPRTAAACGVTEIDRVRVATAKGEREAALRIDRSVRPGVVEAVAGPFHKADRLAAMRDAELLDLCDIRADGTWKFTTATVRKA